MKKINEDGFSFNKGTKIISPNKLLSDKSYKNHLINMINKLSNKYEISKDEAALALSNTFKRIIDEI